MRLFSRQNSQLAGQILFCPDVSVGHYFEHYFDTYTFGIPVCTINECQDYNRVVHSR